MAEVQTTGTLQVDVVTPEAMVFSEQATLVEVPGAEGDLGVLPGHAPLISLLRPGTVTVHFGAGEQRRFFVAGGLAEITPEHCAVLAEETHTFDTLTHDMAHSRLTAAQEALSVAQDERARLKAEREVQIAMVMGDLVKAAVRA